PVPNGCSGTQLSRDQSMKRGCEVQWPYLRFGDDVHLVYNQQGGTQTLRRYIDQPPDYPGIQKYHPFLTAAYGQDDVEWGDLRLRAGLRLEMFDALAAVPSDPANPANALDGAPPSHPQRLTKKISLMPRVGVSYPIPPKAP